MVSQFQQVILCCKLSDRAEWGVCVVPQRDGKPHTAGLPMKPHSSKLPQYSLSTVASTETFFDLWDNFPIFPCCSQLALITYNVLWIALLPTRIISVLFSCRIQSYIGYSYSVGCCHCRGKQRMRIGFLQQKEGIALIFLICQCSLPLHLTLTSSFSVMVTFLLSLLFF